VNQVDIFGAGACSAELERLSLEKKHVGLGALIALGQLKSDAPVCWLAIERSSLDRLSGAPWRERLDHILNYLFKFCFQVQRNDQAACGQQVQRSLVAMNSTFEDSVQVYNTLSVPVDISPILGRKHIWLGIAFPSLCARRRTVCPAQIVQSNRDGIEERVHQCRSSSPLLRCLPARYPIRSSDSRNSTQSATPSCRNRFQNRAVEDWRRKRKCNKHPDGASAYKSPFAL